MRTRTTAAAVTTLLATLLVGCSSGADTDTSSDKAAAKVPAYTVIKDEARAAELLVKDATKASATAAIEDWISENAGDRKALGVQVVRSKDAGTIVCRAEYYADQATADLQSGGRIKADDWPHTEITCPDPGGS